MTGEYVANMMQLFYKNGTCYLKGGWGQRLSESEYQRLLRQYPDNAKYGNEKYAGTKVRPADCICIVKGITSGATPENDISYTQLKAGPLGDCTNEKFYNMLYDCITDPNDMVPGMAIASTKHAGIVLGVNCWADANYTGAGKQNGIAIHYSNPIAAGYRVGKMPGIVYENPVPEPDDVQDFLSYLYKLWKESKK